MVQDLAVFLAWRGAAGGIGWAALSAGRLGILTADALADLPAEPSPTSSPNFAWGTTYDDAGNPLVDVADNGPVMTSTYDAGNRVMSRRAVRAD